MRGDEMSLVYECDKCGHTQKELMHLVRIYEAKATKRGGKSEQFYLCDFCLKKFKEKDGKE